MNDNSLSCASDYLVTSAPNIRKDIYEDEILARTHTHKKHDCIANIENTKLNFRKNGAVRNYFILKFSFKIK